MLPLRTIDEMSLLRSADKVLYYSGESVLNANKNMTWTNFMSTKKVFISSDPVIFPAYKCQNANR